MKTILVIVFIAFAIRAQCRSVELSDELRFTGEEAAANTPEQPRELITSYERTFGKLINFAEKISADKDNNERKIQFLKELGSLIEQHVQEQPEMRSMYTKLDNDTDSILQTSNNKPTTRSMNNVKDLIDYTKEIDIVYQDGDITDEHIRIKRAAGYKENASFATLEERMTNMLIDIQHQLIQVQKCLDKLCKKHHLTLMNTSEEISDDNAN
ncbi:ef-hand calcium-binding domain-containing protein 1, partial [Lasius niger]